MIISAPDDTVFVDSTNIDGETGLRQKFSFMQGIDADSL